MKNRILVLLLCLCMVLTVFAGCGTKETQDPSDTDNGQTSSKDTVETDAEPDFGDIKFDCEINILQRDGAVREEWDAEVEDNTIMQHALIEKVGYLEEKYGVSFQYYAVHVNDVTQVEASILSNSAYYHIMTLPHLHMASMASQGLLRNVAAIENVDLSQPWWSQQLNNELDYKGSLYFATGNSNLCSMWYTNAVFFNKDMAQALGYSVSDIYASVNDHTWTAEKMLSMANELYVDRDGQEGATLGDRYGISQTSAWFPVFYGAGLKLATKNDDGKFVVNTISQDIIDNITSIINYQNDGDTAVPLSAGLNQWEVFANGNALFLMDGIAYSHYVKGSTIDYGILPCPLGESGQANYYNFVHQGHDSAFAVPADTAEGDLAMIGIMLEESNYISRKKVWPEFYNTLMKGQLARDPESAAILDIIFDNLIIDPVLIYGVTNAASFDTTIRKLITDNDYSNVGSTLNGIVNTVQGNLDKYNDAYDLIG